MTARKPAPPAKTPAKPPADAPPAGGTQPFGGKKAPPFGKGGSKGAKPAAPGKGK
jgi:hypothetical protein